MASSPRHFAGPESAHHIAQAEAIRAVAAGDPQALSALYDATSRLVYGLVLRILSSDREAAEEVLLDVYTQVWRQAAQYNPGRGTPLAWMRTIARTRAIDRLRAGRAEQQRREPLDDCAAGVVAEGASVEDEVEAGERGRAVRAALRSLAPEQREVIELAYYGGLSHSEIAAARGLPLGTVKTRTRLGLMRLREALKPVYEGD